MYKIVICDDDRNYIQELISIIEGCNQNRRKLSFVTFCSGEELLENFPLDSDALFLDIQLQGMDGNKIAVLISEKGYRGVLVQCSGIFMPTPETIKISPYRFLLKQADKETTFRDICDIFEEMDRQKACFTIEASYKREKIIVRTMNIVYFTHHKKGSVLHLNKDCQKRFLDAKLITPYNFQWLLERLYPIGFTCPHSSYLINLRYVTEFNIKKEYICVDGKMLSVSRGKLDEFSKDFTQYINLKYREKLK